METQLIITIAGIASAIIGSSWIASVVLRKKYTQEIEILKAEIKRKGKDTDSVDISNMEKTLKLHTELIVEPLIKEANGLRKETRLLRRALEKISVCPHSAGCPVKHELQNDTANE
jgi:hypothetical protein